MRLCHPDIERATAPVCLSFDGAAVEALPGETLAAALAAAGILAFRRTEKGAPRGLFCGMGACFDCLVTVDGKANQRACLVKAQEGMVVESAPPATPAPLAPAPAPAAIDNRACDLLVVGAGPAGLAAAEAAAAAGAHVVVLDERGEAGGQYLKPLAPSHAHAAPDRQFRQGAALRAAAQMAGAEILTGATAWGAFSPAEIGALVGDAAVAFHPRRLILAAGAHERPVPIPGWTLPGVMTTGAMQTLARANRVAPGESVVIAGNGPLNLQLACRLLDGGVAVAAVAEAAPQPGLAQWRQAATLLRAGVDLAWDGLSYLRQLRAAGVPVLWGSMPLACEGEGRFAALVLATPAGERRIEADACALNLGFQPETGLARALGAAHRFIDDGLGRLETVTEEDGRTSLPAVFAIGDGAAIGGARVALARGRLAGLAAARDLGLAAPDDAAARAALRRALDFQAALWRIFAAPNSTSAPSPMPPSYAAARR
ncbi:2Fe-2S iron-sulfur cluster-binding protein [Dankookia sp. P2]|uniref:2Fe-2S iron-sulfur cluster-binding protein n=1 Tax=Dankookia sp. P2 TaxID=3423955 RepID=UPI003D67FC5F